jgi:hypothetical protein
LKKNDLGFGRGVKIFPLLGCCAAFIGSYRRFGKAYRPTFKGQAPQNKFLLNCLTIEDVTDWLSRTVSMELPINAA